MRKIKFKNPNHVASQTQRNIDGQKPKIAKELKQIIQGVINYYCKFSIGHTRYIWNQLNARLLKWVKWEKGLYKMASVRWLKKKYKELPALFPHWKLVCP